MHLINRARMAPGPCEMSRMTPSPRAVLRCAAALALLVSLLASAHAQETEPPALEPSVPAESPAAHTSPAAPVAPPVIEASVPAAKAAVEVPQPSDLRDVSAWVAWKHDRQIESLPSEARIFYRAGIMARQSGLRQVALANMRGAIELDPSFIEPHLKLAGWAFPSDPAQMLTHGGAVVELVRQDFALQLSLAANALILGLEALFAGLLLAAFIVVVQHRHELAHPLREELSRLISARTARLWIPVLLVLPFLAGAGLTLPVLALLAFLWSHLRLRERVLTVTLALAAVFAPLATGTLSRFTQALDTVRGPFHDLPLVEREPWSTERQHALEASAQRSPGSGFAQFALAWYARRGGDLETAEKAFRAARKAWPEDAATTTNLGNVAAMRGRSDEALKLYAEAAQLDPLAAAPHFNASQLHLRRFEYADANRELRTASSLDFDLVKSYQSNAGAGGLLPLVDMWPQPERFWDALRQTPRATEPLPLPLSLRGHLETGGLLFSFASVLALALGGWLGRWQARHLALRFCSNCGVVVCRRCAKRRRETALCSECDAIASGAETAEFSRVLLLQHRGRRRDRERLMRTAFAALVPGYGLLAHQRVFGPTFMLALTWLLGRLLLGGAAPFSLTPRLTLPGGDIPPGVLITLLIVVYAWSLSAYFIVVSRERAREAKLDAASHGRLTQSTRRQPNLAA